MSYTGIYTVGKNHCEKLGEIHNAWRGAMSVWNDMARRYFGLERFPFMWSEEEQKLARRIWNAHNEHDLPEHEQIALTSTMDRVLVKVEDAPRLIAAYRQYGEENPNNSFAEQAACIEAALPHLKPEHYIAFCQTSVVGFHFQVTWDDDNNEIYHDLSDGWDLFKQVDSIRAEKVDA